MLINTLCLKVGHHISETGLCCRLSSLLLNFIHLFKILFGGRIKLIAESILSLCLQWPCLRLRDLVYLETTTHSGVHHDLAWGLDLLKAVEWHVVEIACAVQVSLFVTHHLLEKDISSSLSLLLLEQQIVS